MKPHVQKRFIKFDELESGFTFLLLPLRGANL